MYILFYNIQPSTSL